MNQTKTQVPSTAVAKAKTARLHRVDCGDLKLQYFRWEEESGPVESVYEITTIVPGYGTPRGIQVGSRETEVLEAYGDELLYHLKEDSYTVAPHDDYYTYATPWDGCEIAFFIQKGEVTALRLRLLPVRLRPPLRKSRLNSP